MFVEELRLTLLQVHDDSQRVSSPSERTQSGAAMHASLSLRNVE